MSTPSPVTLPHVIEKMRIEEKYLRVAPYLRCYEAQTNNAKAMCTCDGWKNPLYQNTNPETERGPSRPEDYNCAGCRHRVTSHGALLKLKAEQIDKVLTCVLQIESHHQEATRTQDPAKRQRCMEIVSQLKNNLAQAMRQYVHQNSQASSIASQATSYGQFANPTLGNPNAIAQNSIQSQQSPHAHGMSLPHQPGVPIHSYPAYMKQGTNTNGSSTTNPPNSSVNILPSNSVPNSNNMLPSSANHGAHPLNLSHSTSRLVQQPSNGNQVNVLPSQQAQSSTRNTSSSNLGIGVNPATTSAAFSRSNTSVPVNKPSTPGTGSSTPTSVASDLLSSPPFEQPAINEILESFFRTKFSSLSEEKQAIALKITKHLANGIAKYELPPPKLPSNVYEVSVNDRIYQLNYKRWQVFCKNQPANHSGSLQPQPQPTFNICQAFGKTLLRTIIKDVKDYLIRNVFTQDPVLKDPYISEYFREFEKEINSELSVIIQDHRSSNSNLLSNTTSTSSPNNLSISPSNNSNISIIPSNVNHSTIPSSLTSVDKKRKSTSTSSSSSSTSHLKKSKSEPLSTSSSQIVSNTNASSSMTSGIHSTSGISSSSSNLNRHTSSGMESHLNSGTSSDSLDSSSGIISNSTIGISNIMSNAIPTTANGVSSNGIPFAEPHLILAPDTDLETKARDEKARQEERKGLLRSEVISNDRDPQHMIWLATLKNIFSKQLPKMPKEYIVRLVMDRNHRSLVLLKNNNVVGGIAFRPFKQQGFLEIAFCAIMSSEQVKGYGTHLMNHLKDHAQTIPIYHFLTYADNYAIGYFKKQGFTKTIHLERKKWLGYIKDYDGGTLMECVIHPRLHYMKVPEMIVMQRKSIYDKIKEISNSHVKHKGINSFKDQNGIINIAEIPGIKESGWKPPQLTEADLILLQQIFAEFLEKIKTHPAAWPFYKPVDRQEVPDYYEVIKDPIDLEMMDARVIAGNYYIAKEIFLADLKRMCDNCRVYNHQDTEYYKCANEIEYEFIKKSNRYLRRLESTSTDPSSITNLPLTTSSDNLNDLSHTSFVDQFIQ